MKKFTAMVKARNMEFIRDKGTFFWNLIFPVILIVGFSFAFSGDQDELFKVGLIGRIPAKENLPFLQMMSINYIDYTLEENALPKEKILDRLRFHQIDMLIDFDEDEYFLNKESSKAEVLGQLIQSSNQDSSLGLSEKEVSGKAIRYVDWLVPGVIGMNMLFSCLFGVGFVIVRYRKNGVLKRLKATPVTPLSFITAQMVSRFIIVLLTSMLVYSGTNLFLKFMMLGSYLNLILITAMAILCMISLGLIFAARFKSEELSSGVMNLAIFPMIILSGVFFSLEGTPRIMRQISRIIPLTHYIEASRGIMLEGAGLITIMPNILVLGGMTLLFLGIAGALFQWD